MLILRCTSEHPFIQVFKKVYAYDEEKEDEEEENNLILWKKKGCTLKPSSFLFNEIPFQMLRQLFTASSHKKRNYQIVLQSVFDIYSVTEAKHVTRPVVAGLAAFEQVRSESVFSYKNVAAEHFLTRVKHRDRSSETLMFNCPYRSRLIQVKK